MTKMQEYTYDVAISFAGEDRIFAEYLAQSLQSKFRVFYDGFEKASLWGDDLSETLPRKYSSSRYCVIVQSEEYLEKMWTTLERQAIILEFLSRRGKNYVLPIVIRNCSSSIPGLSGLVGYIAVKSRSDWDLVVRLLFEKLSHSS